VRRLAPWTLVLLLVGVPDGLPAQSAPPATRTFAAPVDQVRPAVESALKGLGWEIDDKESAGGWIVTSSRSVDFKEFGVYGEGTRHRLRVILRRAGDGQTTVAVDRELYREERILWMSNRKPIETTDRVVETLFLDGVQDLVPGAAAAPAPPPAPARSPAPAPAPSPSLAARPPGPSRGEFTFKVTYRVKGTAGSVALTYRNAQGATQQSSVRLPWEVSFDARGGSFLYISAQNQSASGSVTCEIALEEETRTTSTSTGAYVIAECSNSADR
jgi:Mycobacterium membrane protein